MASDPQFEPQQRLHGLSWLFALTAYVKQMIVPIIAFVFFGARNDAELWGALILIPLLLGAVWQQLIYRYGFGPRSLVIHEGLFFRNVRQIEYGRIENIDVERGLLHRLLGVAQVSVATSTGGKPEAIIRVLGLDAVQEMRDRVFLRGRAPEAEQAPVPADEILLHLPPAELIRYGLIDNRGMLVVAAGFGLLAQSGFFESPHPLFQALWETMPVGEFASLGILVQAGFVIAGIVGLILSLRLLSIALALVTLFDFTLSRHGTDFRVRHGLITRLALTLRTRRIQSVHQTETLLHRWFGRVSLRVDLAGDSGLQQNPEQQAGVRARWLAPICEPQVARDLMAAALPDIDLDQAPDWQPLAPHARGRLFRRTVYAGSLLAGIGASVLAFLPDAIVPAPIWIAIATLAFVLIAWLYAHIYVKYTRWALTEDALLYRCGWLTRRLIVAPRNRLQSVQLSTSPFDRRYRMASISIDTAGAGASRDSIQIPLLSIDVAQRLAAALYRSRTLEAATTAI